MSFDKQKIKSNFNRANSRYNEHAKLQKIVANNLFEIAKSDISNAKNIIDLGAGTGFLAENILAKFPEKEITQVDIAEEMLKQNPYATSKIVADIENLPFNAPTFDLGLSSLSFQWVNDLEKTIKSIVKILNDKGSLHFTTLGSQTLKELKYSAKECRIELSINDFISQKELEKIFSNLNLNFQIKSEIITLYYQDCYDLLHSIKLIGASYSGGNNLLNKTQFEALNNFYLKNFNLKGTIPATWEVFYLSTKN